MLDQMERSPQAPDTYNQPERPQAPDISLLAGFLEEATARWKEKGLTIAQKSDEVTSVFLGNDRLILEALPGSGKTTVAPVEFLRALLESNPDARVIVTEPRILAVEAMSEYVGSETNRDFVDFHHAESPFSKPDARLQYIVEQSLRNELVRDPVLSGVDCVVLDEIHSADSILLGLLKEAQALRKREGIPQLKLVLTSGTVDVESFRKYLDDDTAEVKTLTVEGHKYKINEDFLTSPINSDEAPDAAATKVKEIIANPESTSDILIFMPGRREIRKTEEALKSILEGTDIEVVTITGGDSDGNPYAKISNNPQNRRRVYIATDVAETAITIPDVDVIDSGLMKKMVYDIRTRISTLITRAHTKENQTQRKYRAGRTGEGNYYALFTKSELAARDERPMPDFISKDITSDALWMYANGRDPYAFDFKDKPRAEVLDQVVETLQKLGAVDENGRVTDIGKEMSEIDEEPQYARMLVEGKRRKCLDAVALIVGAMKTKNSLFELNKGETMKSKYSEYIDPTSDFITFINAWNASVGTDGQGFDATAIRSIKKFRNKLSRGSSSTDVVGIQIQTPEQKDAINFSIASGIMNKKLVREGGAYKYEDAIYSGIKIDKRSVFSGKLENNMLSGRMNSNGKIGSGIASFSEWNMYYDANTFVEQFDYLKQFIDGKPEVEEVKATEVVESKNESEVQVDSGIDEKAVQNLSEQVVSAPTIKTKQEAETFIEKVRENWHKLTDKVKELYIRFKNSVKKVFRI